jgi:peptide/nickel transport system substrate-binding protein
LFADVRVRRALAMAVDRSRLVRSVFDSLAYAAIAFAPRALVPDTTALVPIAFNVAAARALLDSAGWTMAPGDSLRSRSGVRLTFEIMAPSSSLARQRYAALLQEQLRPLGVGISVRMLEGPAMFDRVMKHDFDSFIHVWDMTPGRMAMAQTWASSGSDNYGGYASAAFDATLDSAFTTFDIAASARTWSHVFQLLTDDAPALPLYEPHAPVALHRRIHNPPLRANGWYQDLAEWSIDPTQRIERDRIGLGSPR